jgi:hypothetical protein
VASKGAEVSLDSDLAARGVSERRLNRMGNTYELRKLCLGLQVFMDSQIIETSLDLNDWLLIVC